MRFTLTYTGELTANANPRLKHEIRRSFHTQLKELWKQLPLINHREWFERNLKTSKVDLNRRVGAFRFVPLVSAEICLICELRIFLLKPEPPGAIITQGGDIDNRLKTLFDALRIPKNQAELPKDVLPGIDEEPFFCLLEEDALIAGVSVETDRLLTASRKPTDVHMDIQVVTRPTQILRGSQLVGNLDLLY